MRNKIISITFVAAIAVAAAWNFSQSSKVEVGLSDIALAADEDTIGDGNIGKRQEYMKGEGSCCGTGIGLCSKHISC
jgi:hypothetical protein